MTNVKLHKIRNDIITGLAVDSGESCQTVAGV